MTRGERLQRRVFAWPWIWAAVLGVFVIATAALAVAVVTGNSEADCTNKALRGRDALTSELAGANVEKVEAQKRAEQVKARGLSDLLSATTKPASIAAFREYQHGEALFMLALQGYIDTSNRIHREQLKHPLGQC